LGAGVVFFGVVFFGVVFFGVVFFGVVFFGVVFFGVVSRRKPRCGVETKTKVWCWTCWSNPGLRASGSGRCTTTGSRWR